MEFADGGLGLASLGAGARTSDWVGGSRARTIENWSRHVKSFCRRTRPWARRPLCHNLWALGFELCLERELEVSEMTVLVSPFVSRACGSRKKPE